MTTAIGEGRWKPTLNSLWDFATERQNVFWRRIDNWNMKELTEDPTLQRLKVDQVNKVMDRDSQFYLLHVLNQGSQSPWEVVWRSLLYKTYPQEHMWHALVEADQHIVAAADPLKIQSICAIARAGDLPVYASSFMATGFGFERDDREMEAFRRILVKANAQDGMEGSATWLHTLVKSLPGYGDFYAWQVVGDLRWSQAFQYITMPPLAPMGPGSLKCAELLGAGGVSDAHAMVHLANKSFREELAKRDFVYCKDMANVIEDLSCVEVEGLFCEFQKVLHAQAKFADGKGHGRVWKRRPRMTYSLPHGRTLDETRGLDRMEYLGRLWAL